MDEDAWIDLLNQRMPPLYRAVSRRVGAQRTLAEDVTQETWLRALDAWRRDGLPDDPGAWLLTVASNLLRNHFRRPAPCTGVDLDSRPALDAAGHAAAEHDAEAARAAALQRGLARLRADQASLLSERHFEGRPLAELAASRGLSERAIEGRLRRARGALARQVGVDLPDAHDPSH